MQGNVFIEEKKNDTCSKTNPSILYMILYLHSFLLLVFFLATNLF